MAKQKSGPKRKRKHKRIGKKKFVTARSQKTFFMPSALCQLAAECERVSGISFTRQVTAAMIEYYFSTRRGPDPTLMKYVVGLEQGLVDVFEIPVRMQEARLEHANEKLEEAGDFKDESNRAEYCRSWERVESVARSLWEHFSCLKGADDVPKTYAAYWGRRMAFEQGEPVVDTADEE